MLLILLRLPFYIILIFYDVRGIPTLSGNEGEIPQDDLGRSSTHFPSLGKVCQLRQFPFFPRGIL